MAEGPPPTPTDPQPDNTLEARVARLEAALARLERRLDALAGAPREEPAGRRPSVNVPPSAPPPPGISLTDRLRDVDLESIIAGRWLNRVGVVAVAVGASYFLKLAIDNRWIGPAAQIAIGIGAGAGVLASSQWFARRGMRYFAEGVAALGAAILYLTLWAGASYYRIVPSAVAFGGMSIVTAAVTLVAVQMRSERLAFMALAGGFATPLLIGARRDAHVLLFIYLLVLNGTLWPLARVADFRLLPLPALFFTELHFWGWYGSRYDDTLFASTALFAAAFFVVFAGVPILGARRGRTMPFAHALLVPLNAAACLTAYAALLSRSDRWWLTFIALTLAALHAWAGRAAARRADSDAPAIFDGVAVVLATLAVPIRLNGPWVTIGWSGEAAALMWSGVERRRGGLRALSYALFVIVALQIAATPAPRGASPVPFFGSRFFAQAITVGCMTLSWQWVRRRGTAVRRGERLAASVVAVLANAVALAALTEQVRLLFGSRSTDLFARGLGEELAVSILWALYATALIAAGLRRSISGLRWIALALFGLTTAKVFLRDLAYLSGFYRVASTIALGVVLLVVSYFYQRNVRRIRPA